MTAKPASEDGYETSLASRSRTIPKAAIGI